MFELELKAKLFFSYSLDNTIKVKFDFSASSKNV